MRKSISDIGIVLGGMALVLVSIIALPSVSAHCPLCTMGAVAAAAGASALGVSNAIVGIFIGAFAVSMGWWIANRLKKQYIPYQKPILIISSYLLTIIPVMVLIQDYYAIFISWGGDYGSLFNRTYIFSKFLVGSIVGGAVLCITPWLSKQLTHYRKEKMVPYQGIILTFVVLIIMSGLFQLFLK